MVQTVEDPKHERIEIVDQPEDIGARNPKKFWLSIPITLAVIATLFFVVRRFMSKKEEF